MKPAVIISGPTGSGKTSFALSLYRDDLFSGIFNADVSQMYRQVSVGVAKPSPHEQSLAPHYLFDAFDCVPHSADAAYYRTLLHHEINRQPQIPLIVGGSLFYLKSLFFKLSENTSSPSSLATYNQTNMTWDQLNQIDPTRARHIHPNDTYRITRALDIFYTSGRLPSECAPLFDPVCSPTIFIFFCPPDQILKQRIVLRVDDMLENGWIEEVEGLIGSPWELFASQGHALCYDDLYQWIKAGKKKSELHSLKDLIIAKTWRYARRQKTFWRSLRRQLAIYPSVSLIESYDQKILSNDITQFCLSTHSG